MSDTGSMTAAQSSTLMNASMATSAISSVTTGFESAAALKAQGAYASSIANTNAALANLKASQTLQTGDVVAARKAAQTRGAVGAVRAAAGGSGVDVSKGSPAMEQSDISTAGAIDVSTIKNNAAREAWGYQTQAIQDTFQGQLEELTAKSKATQSIATGGLQAIAQPLQMMSQAALWRFRYGLKGTAGLPYASGGSNNSGDDFWVNS